MAFSAQYFRDLKTSQKEKALDSTEKPDSTHNWTEMIKRDFIFDKLVWINNQSMALVDEFLNTCKSLVESIYINKLVLFLGRLDKDRK